MTTQHNLLRFVCLLSLMLFLLSSIFSQESTFQQMGCSMASSSNSTPQTSTKDAIPINSTAGIKYIKVAVHFILPTSNVSKTIKYGNPLVTITYNGAGNFTETSDGNGGSYTGYQFAEDIINNANKELDNNTLPYRPASAYTASYYNPPQSLPYRYLLVAVFFHRDNAIYNSGNKYTIHQKYNYMGDQVMDIYEVPEYTESATNEVGNLNGEAMESGGVDKGLITDSYYSYLIGKTTGNLWAMSYGIPALLNHESGHMFGLNHSWNENDGCDDTPQGLLYKQEKIKDKPCVNEFLNCWSHGSKPSQLCPNTPNPCLDYSNVSNNIMDYNAGGWPYHSYTPCQVQKIANDINTFGTTYVKTCSNHCPPPNAFFSIPNKIEICGFQKLIIPMTVVAVNENTYSIIVSQNGKFPTKIFVGTGQMSNYYDLSKYYDFMPNRTYTIALQVDNTNCNCIDQYTQQVTFTACTTFELPVLEMSVKNPFDYSVYISTDITKTGKLKFQLVNQLTSSIEVLEDGIIIENSGYYNFEYDTRHVASGNYILQAIMNETVISKNLLKIE